MEYFRTLKVIPTIPEETLNALRAKQTDIETIAGTSEPGVRLRVDEEVILDETRKMKR